MSPFLVEWLVISQPRDRFSLCGIVVFRDILHTPNTHQILDTSRTPKSMGTNHLPAARIASLVFAAHAISNNHFHVSFI